jgi:hypothetical protein
MLPLEVAVVILNMAELIFTALRLLCILFSCFELKAGAPGEERAGRVNIRLIQKTFG